MENNEFFLNDKEVAKALKLSPSCIRGQRFKRIRGMDHFLTVDARYVGTSPRYVKSEIEAFLLEITA